jgi:hypothetical protein
MISPEAIAAGKAAQAIIDKTPKSDIKVDLPADDPNSIESERVAFVVGDMLAAELKARKTK